MNYISWAENDSVKNAEIDSQHKEMLDIVNELYKYLEKDYDEKAKAVMFKLIEHTRDHFDTEETYMKQLKYPHYISHKLEHDRFYNKILNFSAALEDGTDKLNFDFFKSFKTWFYNHLELNDKKCGEYFNAHLAKLRGTITTA
ncbi:MAG: hemerythrin family protein [Bacteroidetes bacterium]|nr:hemerythrin family protein [Bacteroidota bacterium]